MPLTNEEMDRLLDEHFAYEANDDVDGVMMTLGDDIVHDIVGWPGGVSTSQDQARVFYEQLFSDLAEGQIKTRRRLYGDNFLVDESEWSGKAVGRPFGMEGRGRPLSFRLLHVVEFEESKKMKSEQVWLDFTSIMQQLGE